MEGILSSAIVGADGIPVAWYNPSGIDAHPVSAHLAEVMNQVESSVNGLRALGIYQESLVLIGTSQAWILIRSLNTDCFLVIAAGKDVSLSSVRRIAQKYSAPLRRIL
jgi:predicted regulator of Ras-like GTPase activity (Roadblock/LC7/MglB family)